MRMSGGLNAGCCIGGRRGGLTLIELLVVVCIIGVLAAIVFPVLSKARESARDAQCASNLLQLGAAVQMYLQDYDYTYFPYCYDIPGAGRRWYFGHERDYGKGIREGERELDKTAALLYPYFRSLGGIEICSAFPYHSSLWKPKFSGASYGYGYNLFGLAGKSEATLEDGSRTICFADSAQVNTWQPPASSKHPMLEEFYYVSPFEKTVHFRHQGRALVLFCDGHVQSMPPAPGTLDQRCGGTVGMLCERGNGRLFNVP
jgi:prepilin-type N-terminal cleavage/methylation domain-containing protein/prepilin-type processing-associated H-X9-DG protein